MKLINIQTRDELITRLIGDFALKFSSDMQHLRDGRCPSCGENELFIDINSPYIIQCRTTSDCNYEMSVFQLYPDILEDWSEYFPPTITNPSATVDAYLQSKFGFDIKKWHGSYSQEVHKDYESGFTCPTVRFHITSEGRTVGYWERLIDATSDINKDKIQIGFNYKGLAWLPPKLNLKNGVWPYATELWITECIIDAMALNENGIHAISNITAENYPKITLTQIKNRLDELGVSYPKIVIAFDSDKGTQAQTDKLIALARQQGFMATAAQSSEHNKSKKWHDLHKDKKLGKTDIERYKFYGELLVASTVKDKALLMYNQYGDTNFFLFFNHSTYWVQIHIERYDKAKKMDAISEPIEDIFNSQEEFKEALQLWHDDLMQSCMTITLLMNCQPQVLYFQSKKVTDESWYYLSIMTSHSLSKNTFTSGQLTTASEFKKRLLSIASGVIYTGNSKQLDIILTKLFINMKSVETIDFIGFSEEHNTYVFNNTAICNGKSYDLNEDDYFDLPNNKSLKTLASSPIITIENRPKTAINWLDDLILGWGAKGIISLVGFMGSLFAQQIRSKHGSYPFLEIVGEPGTGKSTLISFFWRLLGRNSYEGIDPNKSTSAGRLRALSQVSNMPTVFIESDRDGAGVGSNSQFDWDELKNLFNGGTISTRGVKNDGNETYEPPFRSTIVISQNLPVVGSQAIMSRICHLFFDTKAQTIETEVAARRIERLGTKDVSHFLMDVLKIESNLLETFFETKNTHETWLKAKGIKSFRAAHCHAQLLALFQSFKLNLIPAFAKVEDDVREEILNMAKERDRTLNIENSLNIQFFEVLYSLNNLPDKIQYGNDQIRYLQLNHSKDESLLAISLVDIYKLANENRYNLPPQKEMEQNLKKSRQFKFIAANRVTSSAQTEKSRRCWIFEQSKTNPIF